MEAKTIDYELEKIEKTRLKLLRYKSVYNYFKEKYKNEIDLYFYNINSGASESKLFENNSLFINKDSNIYNIYAVVLYICHYDENIDFTIELDKYLICDYVYSPDLLCKCLINNYVDYLSTNNLLTINENIIEEINLAIRDKILYNDIACDYLDINSYNYDYFNKFIKIKKLLK